MHNLIRTYLTNYQDEALIKLASFDDSHLIEWLKKSRNELAAVMLSTLSTERAARCLGALPLEHIATLFDEMTAEKVSAIFHRLKPSVQKELLPMLALDTYGFLRDFKEITDHHVGSLSLDLTDSLPDTTPVNMVASLLRHGKAKSHAYLYLTNKTHELSGVITIKEVFINKEKSTPISNLMDKKVECLRVHDRISEAINRPIWESVSLLPLVDDNNFLLGVITYKRLIEHQLKKYDRETSLPVIFRTFGDLLLTSIDVLIVLKEFLNDRRST